MHSNHKNKNSLNNALQISHEAAKLGFDFPSIENVWGKVEEEISELKEAIQEQNPKHIEEELGDLFFSIVNLARFLKVDSEEALKKTCKKFESRFEYVKEKLKEEPSANIEKMGEWWEERKIRGY